MKKIIVLLSLLALLTVVPLAGAQEQIETLCLVTDLGRVNDGTFNQFAHEGALQAADEFDLEYRWIETQAETDYEANIQTCIDEGFEVIITVGFLIADATNAAAAANPDVYFVGVDQFVMDGPTNYVGIQFREDQSGFLAGVLAAQVAASVGSDTVAGVYGIDIPPVKKFRNGFEQGARYINPDMNLLGVYIDNFVAPDRGASAAEQFIGEGASVIFGAGGPTGTGGILAAAQQGIYVIGVDQDEYVTSFGNGETPGSEYIISSAIKRVDQGVYDMVAALAHGDMEGFPGGGVYLMDVALNGVGLAEKHDADIDAAFFAMADDVAAMMIAGTVSTGVDPVTGDLAMMDMMDAHTDDMGMGIETVCLVTDLGRVNDGTFNQSAHEGAEAAADEYDLEYTFIETQAETDYEANIQTCIDEGFEVIITVGFLIADATNAAAAANPDVYFLGVDQFVMDGPTNYVGIQFREDQSGFMTGVLAAFVAEWQGSDMIAGVYGIDIPPVKRFRNGFEQGARYINSDLTILGVYIDSFVAPDRGASAALQFIGEGATVLFGGGGPTGTGAIRAGALEGVYVIGVDKDEWLTSFGAGETPGSEFIISSAMKRVDQGVYDMVAMLAGGDMSGFPGGAVFLMDAAMNGVGLAPPHESDIPQSVWDQVNEVNARLIAGEIETGVNLVSGDLLE
ncbi:MAG: BMP family ABC transporter substrate-binding protein [Chloroflexota bacterium]|nr:BMP family ABC transporter substrate-binding protein [Chloroflexota bacterium]MCY3583300.1 BMP family ABC transporter substrate-binding protein [Chloroflexota bacterium]MDE2649441.1 BMP family ABC transporter substrate-binding protein [Chloroflexota bacterium]MXX51577.1 BMP family ABC transporter substrate-binding protein [Chloroflexota bacterium]MYA93425.1 BMP family ABC transporter substrate-binding protein [Chloroflexota bacterium]